MNGVAEIKTDPVGFFNLDRVQITGWLHAELPRQICLRLSGAPRQPCTQDRCQDWLVFLLLWDGANTEAELGNPPAPFHLVKLTFDTSIIR